MNGNGTDQNAPAIVDLQETQRTAISSRVVSLRIPLAVNAALQRSSADARMTVSGGLDWLMRNSFSNWQLLLPLADCREALDAKLDARIPSSTFEQLRSATECLNLPISVYIRKLLYHFYISKKLRYVQSEGHYTLAGRHD
jgi:hypothetical protein